MAFKTPIAALAALAFSVGAALASDAYTGDATHNPNSNVLVHSYAASANYCPAGLQPVMMGGVICCGTPNTEAYVNRAGGTKHRRYSTSGAYAPEGVKGVVYR